VAIQDSNFLGRGWSFPPSFELQSGTVDLVSGDADIQQSLHVLFSTMPGERTMLPLFGCNLRQYLFEAAGPALFARIRKQMETAVLYYEPRITILDIAIAPAGPIDGQLNVSLTYLIRQTNTRSNMVYPFYLQGEGTNVRRIP
jgi:hypothetical protein